jgi:hypothetical protein
LFAARGASLGFSGEAGESGEGLRLATAACNGRARHPTGAGIAKISLLRTATRIVERHTKHGAFSFPYLGPAGITDENGLSGHDTLHRKSRRRFPLDFDKRSLPIYGKRGAEI